MIHDLKIWPKWFNRVADGSKTFEVRRNDRDFQAGDIVFLQEWDPNRLCVHKPTIGDYTGRSLEFMIGYVMPLDDNNERVAFSLLPKENE